MISNDIAGMQHFYMRTLKASTFTILSLKCAQKCKLLWRNIANYSKCLSKTERQTLSYHNILNQVEDI